MLRPDLLAQRRIVVGGAAPEGRFAAGIAAGLRSLGADVMTLAPEMLADEDAAAAWAREQGGRGQIHALVLDGGGAFGAGGADGVQAALAGAWPGIRAVATGAMIEPGAGGRIVLVAPPAGAGPYAEAAAAGLENLARTLSVEWARFSVTAVAIAPGAATGTDEVTELVAYLVSPAGGYLSGCRLDLGTVGAPARS